MSIGTIILIILIIALLGGFSGIGGGPFYGTGYYGGGGLGPGDRDPADIAAAREAVGVGTFHRCAPISVMAGLVPAIHVLLQT